MRVLVRRLRRPTRSELALGVLIAVFVAYFGTLAYAHQRNFGNFSFDLGIYDQGIWLLSQGDSPFVTVRGLHLFGHHVNLILLLWAPFYRLGAGAGFLVVSEVVIVGLAAVPVYLLARDRLREAKEGLTGLLAVGLAAALLLNPSLENQVWWTFHPDTIAILPVLCTWLYATRRRWRAAAIWAVVALACKEDVALTLAAMAVVLARREREKLLLVPAAASAAWFAFATRVLMPVANQGIDPFYLAEFDHLGRDLPEIAWNVVRHPSRWLDRLVDARAANGPYAQQLTAPFAVAVPLLAWPELLIVLPQFFINSVTRWPYAADATYHYSAMPIAALAICTVEGVGRLPTAVWRRGAVALVVAASILANIAWAPSALGGLDRWVPRIDAHDRADFVWRRHPHPHQAAAEAAFALIPADASVSATFYFVPQLTHRHEIYEFPTPFQRFNYSVPGEQPPDPATVDYVVVDDQAWYVADHQLVFLALQQPGSGFEQIYSQDHVVVLRRTADPLSEQVRRFGEIDG